MSEPRLYAFLCAIVLILVLWAFLKFTLVGKALRAVAENRSVAALMGIRVTRLYLLAFGVGAAITGIAGTLLLPFSYVFPTRRFKHFPVRSPSKRTILLTGAQRYTKRLACIGIGSNPPPGLRAVAVTPPRGV